MASSPAAACNFESPAGRTLSTRALNLTAFAAAVGLAVALAWPANSADTTPARFSPAVAAPAPLATSAAADGLSGLLSLPIPAQVVANRDLGAGNPGFRTVPAGSGAAAHNPAQGMTVKFTADGPTVSTGSNSLALSLTAVGFGKTLQRPGRASPTTTETNAVEYQRGTITERYDNGPLGLAQSFILRTRPTGVRNGDLTLSLSTSKGFAAAISPDARSAIFLENGQAAFSYRGLSVADSRNRQLPARLVSHRAGLSIHINDRGAIYPLTVDPFIGTGSTTGGNGYGYSVAAGVVPILDNEPANRRPPASQWVLVGDPFYTTPAGAVGRALLYGQSGPTGTWTLHRTETGKQAGAQFGYAVGLHVVPLALGANQGTPGYAGAYLNVAIGAPYHDIWSADQGAVFFSMFMLIHGVQALPAQSILLYAGDGAAGDKLGASVAIGNDHYGFATIIGGSPKDDYGTIADAGSARIWHLADGGDFVYDYGPTVSHHTSLGYSSPMANDQAGTSVALSSDGLTAVVGAPGDDDVASAQGSAAVFVAPPGSWDRGTPYLILPSMYLTAAQPEANDTLGRSVAISGDGMWVAVGAPLDNKKHSDQGTVRVYRVLTSSGTMLRRTEGMILAENDTSAAAGDWFGQSVALDHDGSTLVAGAPNAEDNVGGYAANEGAAFVFEKPSVGWLGAAPVPQMLFNGSEAANDRFGATVSIDSHFDNTRGVLNEHIAVGIQRVGAGSHQSFIR